MGQFAKFHFSDISVSVKARGFNLRGFLPGPTFPLQNSMI